MAGGRAPGERGKYHERKMVRHLRPYGFRRVPSSGAAGGDYTGDLRRAASGAPKAIEVLESKYRKGGQRNLRRWVCQSGAHGLVLPGDGRSEEPLIVLELARFVALLEEAGYRAPEPEPDAETPGAGRGPTPGVSGGVGASQAAVSPPSAPPPSGSALLPL